MAVSLARCEGGCFFAFLQGFDTIEGTLGDKRHE